MNQPTDPTASSKPLDGSETRKVLEIVTAAAVCPLCWDGLLLFTDPRVDFSHRGRST